MAKKRTGRTAGVTGAVAALRKIGELSDSGEISLDEWDALKQKCLSGSAREVKEAADALKEIGELSEMGEISLDEWDQLKQRIIYGK